MLRLSEVTEENWQEAASLSVKEEQKGFVAPAVGIIARGYVYRACRGRVFFLARDAGLTQSAAVARRERYTRGVQAFQAFCVILPGDRIDGVNGTSCGAGPAADAVIVNARIRPRIGFKDRPDHDAPEAARHSFLGYQPL